MTKIYIAGAITEKKHTDMFNNISKGIKTASDFLKEGFAPFCPFLDYQFLFYNNIEVQKFYDYSIEFLKTCDIIYVLKGYEESKGTIEEIKVAHDKGILIVYQEDFETFQESVKHIKNSTEVFPKLIFKTEVVDKDLCNIQIVSYVNDGGKTIITNIKSDFEDIGEFGRDLLGCDCLATFESLLEGSYIDDVQYEHVFYMAFRIALQKPIEFLRTVFEFFDGSETLKDYIVDEKWENLKFALTEEQKDLINSFVSKKKEYDKKIRDGCIKITLEALENNWYSRFISRFNQLVFTEKSEYSVMQEFFVKACLSTDDRFLNFLIAKDFKDKKVLLERLLDGLENGDVDCCSFINCCFLIKNALVEYNIKSQQDSEPFEFEFETIRTGVKSRLIGKPLTGKP